MKRGQAPPVPAPKVHKTFDDDDESDVDLPSAPDADDQGGASSETDSDSEVEELTMSASRAIARQQTAAKIEQRSRYVSLLTQRQDGPQRGGPGAAERAAR